MKGSAPGWCSGGASAPCRAQLALPLRAGGNPSVNGAHLVHSSRAKAFLQDTFQHSVAELGAQGAREGQGGLTPSPSSVPRSSSASWITTSVKKILKTSSSSQAGGVAAPGPGLAVPKGMAAAGSGKRELQGLGAHPGQCQHIRTAAPSLCCGLSESIPSCGPRLCSAVGAAIPFPWDAGVGGHSPGAPQAP